MPLPLVALYRVMCQVGVRCIWVDSKTPFVGPVHWVMEYLSFVRLSVKGSVQRGRNESFREFAAHKENRCI